MNDLPAYLALGVIRGMVYGIVALGITLVYKGSRTLNLAQPFMGLFCAFVAWYLTGWAGIAGVERTVVAGIDSGPWIVRWLRYPLGLFAFELGSRPRFALAAIASLLLIAWLSLRVEHDVIRRLQRAPRLVTLVATIALAQGFLGAVMVLFERNEEQATQLKRLPALLPDDVSFAIGSLPVTNADVQILVAVPAIALATTWFFKRSKFGIAVRATAENPEAAQLLGISARRVSRFTWVAAGVLAGFGALLIIPSQQALDSQSLGMGLLVRSLAAALVGGLTSLPGAFVGGIVVGVAEFVIRWRTLAVGIPETALFAIVIVILVLRPGGLFGRAGGGDEHASIVPELRDLSRRLRGHPTSRKARTAALLVGTAFVSSVSLATGPFTNGVLIDVLVFAIVGVSLTVLMAYAGQVSIGHFAFVGVGAFAAGNLYEHGPVPFGVMIPLVVLIGMAVSLVIGLPALRIRGPYLAVVTLAFAVATSQWVFSSRLIARGTGGTPMSAPDLGWIDLSSGTNRPLFFFALSAFLACAWIADNLRASGTGRGFFSLRDNEKAATTLGLDVTRYRLIAFTVSGGMAALAGVVFALRAGHVAAIDFPPVNSLLVVAMVIIGGLGSIVGALLGAFLMVGVPPLLQSALGSAPWVPLAVMLASGVALIVTLVWARGGLAAAVLWPRRLVLEGLIAEDERVPSSPAAARSSSDGRDRGEPTTATPVGSDRPDEELVGRT